MTNVEGRAIPTEPQKIHTAEGSNYILQKYHRKTENSNPIGYCVAKRLFYTHVPYEERVKILVLIL